MAKFPLKNVLEGTKHFWTKTQGPDAEGAAATGNPVAIGYKDGGGLIAGVTPTNVLPVGDAAAQATLTAIQGYIDGLEAVLGTVDASPTAYTVVARLKDLATALGEVGASPTANTVLARIKTLEGYLDGVEAALGATTDAEATGNGSVIAIVKQLRKLVTDAYATFGSAAPTKGLMVAGTDGTNARAIKTNEAGEVVTQVAGRNVAKTKVTNWVNAETIRAGGSKTYYYPTLNYPDELYLLMRIDKQPWSITGSTPFMTVAGDRHIFPNYDLQNPATITASSTYEMITLFVTGGFSKAYRGIGFNPATLDEAKKRALPMQGLSGKTLSFYNKHATDDCTLSIQLLEVWR